MVLSWTQDRSKLKVTWAKDGNLVVALLQLDLGLKDKAVRPCLSLMGGPQTQEAGPNMVNTISKIWGGSLLFTQGNRCNQVLIHNKNSIFGDLQRIFQTTRSIGTRRAKFRLRTRKTFPDRTDATMLILQIELVAPSNQKDNPSKIRASRTLAYASKAMLTFHTSNYRVMNSNISTCKKVLRVPKSVHSTISS